MALGNVACIVVWRGMRLYCAAIYFQITLRVLLYGVVLRGNILFNLVILTIQISIELSILSYDSVFVYTLILVLVYISECHLNLVCCCLILPIIFLLWYLLF